MDFGFPLPRYSMQMSGSNGMCRERFFLPLSFLAAMRYFVLHLIILSCPTLFVILIKITYQILF